MGIFTHLFRFPRQGQGTGVLIKFYYGSGAFITLNESRNISWQALNFQDFFEAAGYVLRNVKTESPMAESR
jgi:hypothetical protein